MTTTSHRLGTALLVSAMVLAGSLSEVRADGPYDEILRVLERLERRIDVIDLGHQDLIRLATRPDLVPRPRPDQKDVPERYNLCQLETKEVPGGGELNLIVRVGNRGFTTAGESNTKVNFYTRDDTVIRVTRSTPAIPGNGGTALLRFPVPHACFIGTKDEACEFSIEVDSSRMVGELEEFNNYAKGLCPAIQ